MRDLSDAAKGAEFYADSPPRTVRSPIPGAAGNVLWWLKTPATSPFKQQARYGRSEPLVLHLVRR
jgi:hypothetical protein